MNRRQREFYEASKAALEADERLKAYLWARLKRGRTNEQARKELRPL